MVCKSHAIVYKLLNSLFIRNLHAMHIFAPYRDLLEIKISTEIYKFQLPKADYSLMYLIVNKGKEEPEARRKGALAITRRRGPPQRMMQTLSFWFRFHQIFLRLFSGVLSAEDYFSEYSSG
jgi:hypothetical protein